MGMRLKNIIRARKVIRDAGVWKSGVKMPKTAFPLGKGNFKVPAPYNWRVVSFECLGERFKLLIFYRLDLEKYSVYLGRDEGGEMVMQARYEWHRGEGWHLHCCEDCDDSTQPAGAPGLRRRVPAANQRHRRMNFDIHDDDSAFRAADAAFRLTSFDLTTQ